MRDGLILLIPARADVERDAVASVWESQGGSVLRLDRFWEPPVLHSQSVRLYGNDTFCQILAQKLHLELVSPIDDLLLTLPPELLGREILSLPLSKALEDPFPRFLKPLVPKLFRASVYQSAHELQDETRGLDLQTLVLSSNIVQIHAEARSFVLGGEVQTCAVYEGEAEADEAQAFLQKVANNASLPATCVLDAALLDTGWALLEANATWGAGLNGCNPEAVCACLERATYSRPS